MTSFKEMLGDRKLRRAEIKRLTKAAVESRKAGNELDAAAFEGALQLYTDAEQGTERCYACGKLKRRRR